MIIAWKFGCVKDKGRLQSLKKILQFSSLICFSSGIVFVISLSICGWKTILLLLCCRWLTSICLFFLKMYLAMAMQYCHYLHPQSDFNTWIRLASQLFWCVGSFHCILINISVYLLTHFFFAISVCKTLPSSMFSKLAMNWSSGLPPLLLLKYFTWVTVFAEFNCMATSQFKRRYWLDS